MGIQKALNHKESRSRLFGLALMLGIFSALPVPSAATTQLWNVFDVSLWVLTGLLSWSLWYRSELLPLLWFFAWGVSALAFWKVHLRLPALLLSAWGLWFYLRVHREAIKRVLAIALLGIGAVGFSRIVQADDLDAEVEALSKEMKAPPPPAAAPSSPAPEGKPAPAPTEAPAPPPAPPPPAPPAAPKAKPAAKPSKMKGFPKPVKRKGPLVRLPKYLTGYELNDIVSCGAVDEIPWKYRPDRRRSRLLVKDKFRFQTETEFMVWEIYQVMDAEGYVTYIFRRHKSNGRFESIVTKDILYNRIEDTPDGPKVVEVQDLRALINRPALSFYLMDGSSMIYSPSTTGKSALIIQLSPKSGGRLLPPIYLRGNYCDKPGDEENSDTQIKKTGAGGQGGATP